MQKHSDDYREDLRGNADSFWDTMKYHNADYTMSSWQVAMNELSNHDHSRFLTRTNHKVGRTNTMGPEPAGEGVDKAVFREAVLLQMTWVGAPTIYYGDEAGVCGFTDPDNRRTYPWGGEDKELIEFHRQMIRIHKENPEIKIGSMLELHGEYNVLAYGRFTQQEQCVIVLNNNETEITKSISVWEIGIPREAMLEQLILTSRDGFTTESTFHPVKGGKLSITLPPASGVVLKYSSAGRKNFLQFQ